VVCTREEEPAAAGCVLWPGRSARSSFKLTDLGVVADLEDAVAWQPPLRCETSTAALSPASLAELRDAEQGG
jgi:hypothetical protein